MTCEYCNDEFAPNGIQPHRRRCKRAKPEDRQLRLLKGSWRQRNASRSVFGAAPGGRSFRQAVGAAKIARDSN